MSADNTYDEAIRALVRHIESTLGWGSGLEWSTRDFEQLSKQILERTGVQLSVVTLKRVWKKIDYAGKPTSTTLDALAAFAGARNWQQFKQRAIHTSYDEHAPARETATPDSMAATHPIENIRRRLPASPSGRSSVIWITVAAGAVAAVLYFTAFRPSATSRGKAFSFSSKKVVDTGVPNTVIFDYDVSACAPDDSVSIQQSWDPKLSTNVDPKSRQHTSIYYHPGFFDARLKVNGEVVLRHNLLIKTDGWLPLLDTKPSPVYFSEADLQFNGALSLPLDRIRATGIALQPDPPWCNYYKVGDLPEILSDDFLFETRVRSDFGEGAAACRYTEVHILFEGAAMVIPLSIPGCVSTLEFYDKGGRVTDPSALGVALDKWVPVRFQMQDTVAWLDIDGRRAFDLRARMKPSPWVGMIFKFRGSGSVEFVRVSRKNGDVVYEESFANGSDDAAKALNLQSSNH